VAIGKSTPYSQLRTRFQAEEELDLLNALQSLEKKGLIESDMPVVPSSDADLLRAQIDSFSSTDFFSSSLDPMRGGSGIVVDTKASSMLPVKPRKLKPKTEVKVDVDIFLPLDGVENTEQIKKRPRNTDAISVFPEPKPPKRKRRSRKPPPPESKWKLAIYIGLIVTGIGLALFALFAGG
jgi:hypothetical protein